MPNQRPGESNIRLVTTGRSFSDNIFVAEEIYTPNIPRHEIMTPERTSLSKSLVFVLRHSTAHGGKFEGLKFSSGGWITEEQLLEVFKSGMQGNSEYRLHMTSYELQVTMFHPQNIGHRPRYQLAKTRDGMVLYRAMQGHTNQEVNLEKLGDVYDPYHNQWSETLVHGTTESAVEAIREHGVKTGDTVHPSGRPHIHLLRPEGTTYDQPTIWRGRHDATHIIVVSARRLYQHQIPLYINAAGTILTDGGKHGVIPIDCICDIKDLKIPHRGRS